MLGFAVLEIYSQNQLFMKAISVAYAIERLHMQVILKKRKARNAREENYFLRWD